MNQMTINLDKGQAVIELSCEHRLRREPRVARYTNQDQQVIYAGDRFFDLTHTIQGFVGRWGSRDTGYGSNVPYTGPNIPQVER